MREGIMQGAERIRAKRVAEMTGLGVRGVQKMATQRRISSVAKLGKVWTFREEAIRAWIEEKEAKVADSSSPYRDVSRLPAASIDAAYEQAIGLKPRKDR